MALESYHNEHRARLDEQYRQALGDSNFDNIINITRE
jgi:hypothetical protein